MADDIAIAPGERETVISAGNVREFFAEVKADVEIFLSSAFAGRGERAQPDDRGFLSAPRGTRVVAYNPGTSEALINLSPTGRTADWFDQDGFVFERQTRSIVNVGTISDDINVGTVNDDINIDQVSGRVAVDIAEQSIGTVGIDLSTISAGTIQTDISNQSVGDLDINLNGNSLTSDLEIDVAAQSIGNLLSDVNVESSRSVVEINADQTTDLNAGESQVTTVTPPAGELWRLTLVDFFAPGPAAGGSSDDHRVRFRTEQENILIASGSVVYTTPLTYAAGEWGGSGVNNTSTPDGNEITFDSTNGLEVFYESDTAQTGDREIRLKFEVVTNG